MLPRFDLYTDFWNWEGITWGYTFAIICCAFMGKFGGCTLAARFLAGFSWRESGAIGSLMSCKGWAFSMSHYAATYNCECA